MTGTSEHANHRDRRSRALQSAMSLWREARFGCNDWRVSDRDWDLESQYFFCHTHTTTNQSPIHTKIARWLTRLLSTFNTLLSLSLSSYLYFSFLCWFSYFSSAALFGCLLFMKMDLSRRLFNAVDSSQKFWINVGFEPRTSDVGSNSSVNWAQLPYSLSHFSVSFGTFSINVSLFYAAGRVQRWEPMTCDMLIPAPRPLVVLFATYATLTPRIMAFAKSGQKKHFDQLRI